MNLLGLFRLDNPYRQASSISVSAILTPFNNDSAKRTTSTFFNDDMNTLSRVTRRAYTKDGVSRTTVQFFRMKVTYFRVVRHYVGTEMGNRVGLLHNILYRQCSKDQYLYIISGRLGPAGDVRDLSSGVYGSDFVIPTYASVHLRKRSFSSMITFRLLLNVFRLFRVSADSGGIYALFNVDYNSSVTSKTTTSVLRGDASYAYGSYDFSDWGTRHVALSSGRFETFRFFVPGFGAVSSISVRCVVKCFLFRSDFTVRFREGRRPPK